MKQGARTESVADRPVDYVPLVWPEDSALSSEEREHVDRERLSLWNHGVRREPQLTRMAFEFGAVASLVCGKKAKGRSKK